MCLTGITQRTKQVSVSGVTVMKRPWPLVEASGFMSEFISVSEVKRSQTYGGYMHYLTAIPQRKQASVRSGVAVMWRPWPLAKGNGFVLVSEFLPGNIPASSKLVMISGQRGRSLLHETGIM
jgi:hypothetical protein